MGARWIVTGHKELDRALKRLEPKIARKVVRQAMRKAMKPLLDAARQNMPEGETGELKDSVKLRALPRSRKGFGVQVVAESDHVAAVEFGTEHQTPQAPMRRAFDEKAGAARAECIRLIAEGVEREAASRS